MDEWLEGKGKKMKEKGKERKRKEEMRKEGTYSTNDRANE